MPFFGKIPIFYLSKPNGYLSVAGVQTTIDTKLRNTAGKYNFRVFDIFKQPNRTNSEIIFVKRIFEGETQNCICEVSNEPSNFSYISISKQLMCKCFVSLV